MLARTLRRAVWALVCACAVAAGTQAQAGNGSGFAEVNGTKLYYEALGKGPAVVLVHGGLVDMRLWGEQMGPLSKEFRVVRFDLRALLDFLNRK
ncbi:MAG: alpha/beta fold hydrolase [Pyrinomonadaceae bacterium]